MNSGRERTLRGASQLAASSVPQSAKPKSWVGDGWIVLHDNDADTVADDNNPETLAIFLQQFGLRDGTTDAPTSAAPAPKRMPRRAHADDAERRPRRRGGPLPSDLPSGEKGELFERPSDDHCEVCGHPFDPKFHPRSICNPAECLRCLGDSGAGCSSGDTHDDRKRRKRR